jgi:hypothetical protein
MLGSFQISVIDKYNGMRRNTVIGILLLGGICELEGIAVGFSDILLYERYLFDCVWFIFISLKLILNGKDCTTAI